MELYRKVRLACRDGMSERAAARHFGVSRQSVRKMLQFSVPPGYRRTAPVRRPKLDEFIGLIDQWLEHLALAPGTQKQSGIVHRSPRRGGLDDPTSPGNTAYGAVRKCGSGAPG